MKDQKNNNLTSKVSKHYANVATSYNQSFFTEDGSDYQKWQLNHVLHHLRLQPTDQVVDLGCGTGVYSTLLYTEGSLRQNVLAVEPSQSMLDEAQTLPGLTPHCADALSFAQDKAIRYDKILMQGMIHHIPREDLPELYRDIYQQLSRGGVLVTVTRPVIPPYPFWEAALELWQQLSIPEEIVMQDMSEAGFQVSYQTYAYPVQILKTQWFEMIRNHFWSLFTHFNDEEVEEGLAELQAKYAKTDLISFEEALIFIESVKR